MPSVASGDTPTATSLSVTGAPNESTIEPERVESARRRWTKTGIKTVLLVVAIYLWVIPLFPKFAQAISNVREVKPLYLVIGFALEMIALWCYAPLMRAGIGSAADHLSTSRLYRIQMSTRALSSVVPGGSAASSALGYRLQTLSGVGGTDAGFALATVGIGSAVVVNLLLWVGLLISIPIRGVQRGYAWVAMAGVALMVIAGVMVWGLMKGKAVSERFVRSVARRFRGNEDKAAAVMNRIAERLELMVEDKPLLRRALFWSVMNWSLDAAALWVFLLAFDVNMMPDAILISFGLANVLAAVPITPGGIGYVDESYLRTLVGFGAAADNAVLGIAAYRTAQFFFPIILGGLLYLSLRVGPWSIENRDRARNDAIAAAAENKPYSKPRSIIGFWAAAPMRDERGNFLRRTYTDMRRRGERLRAWRRSADDS